jgi:hypothetical protein
MSWRRFHEALGKRTQNPMNDLDCSCTFQTFVFVHEIDSTASTELFEGDLCHSVSDGQTDRHKRKKDLH